MVRGPFARLSGSSTSNGSNAKSSHSRVPASLLSHLHQLCGSPESHPFVRPLGNVFSVVDMVVHGRSAPFPVEPALAAAAAFLEPTMDPANRLLFALHVHTSHGTQRFLGGVGGALAVLAQAEDRVGLVDAVQDVSQKWDRVEQMFNHHCQEAWELYVYFVFLDIKGERTLMKDVVQEFCALLDCTPHDLSLALVNTRPWAEKVLQSLANKEFQPLLPKLHEMFLREWHTQWLARYTSDPIGDEEEFWESWFPDRYKITWADFVEGFQALHMEAAAPSDVRDQLHSLIDPSCGPHVTQAQWTTLFKKHGSIKAIMQQLLDNILSDITSHIYRAEALPHVEGTQLDEPPNMSGPVEDDKRRSSSSHKQPTSTPYTKASESITKAGVPQNMDASSCETPPDHLVVKVSGEQERMTWSEYHARLSGERQNQPWWLASGAELTQKEFAAHEKLRVDAVRVVRSSLKLTDRALVLRVMTGNLAENKLILETPGTAVQKEKAQFPAIVVMGNSAQANGVVTFGRGSEHSTPVVDHILPEPIVSRSHFCISYDQNKHRYSLADNGTKWGTFVQISKPTVLKCGDWIRVGTVEFLVRYCGGTCRCYKWHGQYRSQSSLQRSRQYIGARAESVSELPRDRLHELDADTGTEIGREVQLKGELALLLSSNSRRSGWISTATRLSHADASQKLPTPHCSQDVDERTADAEKARSEEQSGYAPVKPLEIEFISGPRMGEKAVLWDRKCTIGRCASNTLQVYDPSVVNLSRVHCILEYVHDRWQIHDNKSTNGTWKRLSCILEPSEPFPLVGGEVIMAGAHEFKVEALPVPEERSRLPFVASQVLGEMGGQ